MSNLANAHQRLDPDFADIRQALLQFRYDPKYRGYARRVPIVQLAEFVGVTRQTLYHIMHNAYAIGLTPDVRDRLRAAIKLIEQDGLRWRRSRKWEICMRDGSQPPAQLAGVERLGPRPPTLADLKAAVQALK